MAIFTVKFPNGYQMTINSADSATHAMSKAFMAATQPVYCRIHEGIAEQSSTPVGQRGYYYPSSAYPISAQPLEDETMIVQCDQPRRDHDKQAAARQIAHIKQAKRNKREWLRRAADACRKGQTELARNLIVRAEQELPA